MRQTRLTTTLVAVGLAAAACGTASTPSSPTGSHGSTGPIRLTHGSPVTAHEYASLLMAKVMVPPGATVAVHAPSKALEHLPESPSLAKTPTVLIKYWSATRSASAVYAWLKAHAPGPGLVPTGTAASTQPDTPVTQTLAYRASSLPGSIGAGYLYLAVISTGPSSSAIAAYAVTLAQPPRPAAEKVPLDLTKAVISWSLAPGGTPVLKTLQGAAAARLARDFNALRVDTAGMVPCPMIPQRYADIIVTFTGSGHTWTVDIPACPDIRVQRDGTSLASLAFGNPFLADVKGYTGYLPHFGPPRSPGAVVPLYQTPPAH